MGFLSRIAGTLLAACATGTAAAGMTETVALNPVREPRALAALQLPGPDGIPHTLHTGDRTITLLHLWATWCGPCREELPALDHLPPALGECDVRVVAIAEDRAEDVRMFLQQQPLQMTVLIDSYGEALYALSTRAFPETHVLDPAGRLRLRATGTVDWRSDTTLNALAALCK